MTRYEPRDAQHTGVFYAEDHSAIPWQYAAHIIGWLPVLVIGIAMSAINPSMSFVMVAGMIGVLLPAAFAVKMWPVGIRVGGDGIRIGGVRLRPKPRKNPPWAFYQHRQVLFCPWDAVRRIAVVTDKSGLRDARSLRGRQGELIRIGVLTGPFTRAALLIETDPERVVTPEFREPQTERPLWTPPHMESVELSPVWYVPTRRPGALRAALSQHAGSFGNQSDPRLPAHLRLLLERADVTRS